MTATEIPLRPDTFVSDLQQVADRLKQLLMQERHFLDARRPAELAPLIEEKTRLFAIYRKAMLALREDPRLVTDHRSSSVAALMTTMHDLHLQAQDVTARLSRLRHVNEGVLHSISQEVARRNAPVRAYGKDATFKVGLVQTKAHRPTTILLNQSV